MTAPPVLVYCQHLLGLGHAQRTARLVRALDEAGEPVVVVTGGRPVPGLDWGNAAVISLPPLTAGDDAASSLAIGNRVSDALIAIMRSITTQPRYVLAKGGITSSDVATKALGVKRAMVLGQLLPGVPVWQLGPESRYPDSLYVVFPGNVGGPTALAEAHELLANK